MSSSPSRNVDQDGIHNQCNEIKHKHDNNHNDVSYQTLFLDILDHFIDFSGMSIHFICKNLQRYLIPHIIDFKMSQRGKDKWDAHENQRGTRVCEMVRKEYDSK